MSMCHIMLRLDYYMIFSLVQLDLVKTYLANLLTGCSGHPQIIISTMIRVIIFLCLR